MFWPAGQGSRTNGAVVVAAFKDEALWQSLRLEVRQPSAPQTAPLID